MTVPTYQPKLWAEVWTRPGHAAFDTIIADPAASRYGVTLRANGVGQGNMDVSANYDRLDDILRPDPLVPLNARSSLVRIFHESVAYPIAEWIPTEITGAAAKDDQTVAIKGADIFSVIGYARLEAWDWDGTDDHTSKWPDWIWGGRNLLGPMEASYKPAVTRFSRDVAVTGGTWIIGISINGGAISNTNTIAWNVTAPALDTEITAELVAMGYAQAVVEVSGSGSIADPWRVQSIFPEAEYTFTVDSSGLTPSGRINQDRESIGALLPSGYTTSFNPVNNLSHGQVNIFRATTFTSPDPAAPACDTTGVGIMFDGDAGDYPGIQKIIPVKPGGRYYAYAQAYAQGASGTYRFVIRDLFENGIAAEPDFDTGTTITANTWTEFNNMVAVVIPDDVDRVIVRFAAVGGTNPPPTFLACLELREGMPPTTWGDIWHQIFDDATVDHAGRVVWEIGTTGVPYITLDFTPLVDSNGVPWTHSEVNITLKREQSYLRIAQECFKQGYEGRLVVDNWQTGTWKFQLYNEGTAGTVLNLATSPVIMGGDDVTKRDIRRFLPTYTDWAVEAAGQAIARRRNANAITALGRIEGYTPNQDLGTIAEAAQAAETSLLTGLATSQSLTYTVLGRPGAEPLINYKVFDTINVDDSPEVPKTPRRIRQVAISWDANSIEQTIQLGSESYVGVGAIYEGVKVLLAEYKAIRDRPGETTDPLNYMQGSGSAPTVVVAASNSTQFSKDRADFVCTGANDEGVIQMAMDYCVPLGGIVWLCEGGYSVEIPPGDAALVVPVGVSLQGVGHGMNGVGASIEMQNLTDPGRQALIRMRGHSEIHNLTLYAWDSAIGVELTDYEGFMKITDCWIDVDGGACIEGLESNEVWIERNLLFNSGNPLTEADSAIHVTTAGIVDLWISRNWILGGWHGVFLDGDQGRNFVIDNYISQSWYSGVRLRNTVNPIFATVVSRNVISVPGQGSDGSTGEAGVYISADGADIDPTLAQSNGLIVADNVIEVASTCYGIRLTDCCLVNVHNNYIEQQGLHGIFLEDANACQIHDNTIQEPNTFPVTSYDGIHLVTSDDNYIRANTIVEHRGGSPAYFRYAINISDAASDRNIVVGNDLRLAGSGTGFINDAGTGTRVVYPGAAAPVGDNFV